MYYMYEMKVGNKVVHIWVEADIGIYTEKGGNVTETRSHRVTLSSFCSTT